MAKSNKPERIPFSEQTFLFGSISGSGLIRGLIVLAIIVIGFFTPDAKQLKAKDAEKTATLHQIIESRQTLEEIGYRIPIENGKLYATYSINGYGKVFLCDQITILGPIVLPEDRTTILTKSGSRRTIRDGKLVSEDDDSLRCWNDARTAYTETSYYEFADGIYLILTDYVISELDRDEAYTWGQEHKDEIPQIYLPINP